MRFQLKSLLLCILVWSFGCTVNHPAETSFSESSLSFQQSQFLLYIDQDSSIIPMGIPKDTSTCLVSPDLPDGLSLNNSCQIQGQPRQESGLQKYQISAHTSNSSQTSEIWIEVRPQLPFDDFNYPSAFYKFQVPKENAAVVPNYVGGKPRQCYVQPSLPLGLKLNSDCSITGNLRYGFSKRKHTIVGIANEKTVTRYLEIEGETKGITSDLVWYFDAKMPSVLKTHSRTCDGAIANTWAWDNLVLNSVLTGVLQPFDEPNRGDPIIPCLNTSGWYGNGTPENPYRWRSDGDVLFIEQKSEYFSDFTMSFWARALSNEVSFISSFENDDSDPRSSFRFAADSNKVLFQIFSKRTPLDWENGLTFPGVFVYDNFQDYVELRSHKGMLLKATDWYPPPEEWHMYTLTQDSVSKVIKFYIDGIEVLSTIPTYYYLTSIGPAGNYAIKDRKNYILGGMGKSEFTQIKLFKKVLTPAQIAEECLAGKGDLLNTSCSNDIKSYFLELLPIPKNSCVGFPLILKNLNGLALAPGQDLTFDLILPTSITISENSDCSNAKNSLIYGAAQTSKMIYIKSTENGTKPIGLSPRGFSSPRSIDLVTTNTPSQVASDGPLEISVCSGTLVRVSILDSLGQPAVFASDVTGSIDIVPVSIANTSVPFQLKAGQSEAYVPIEARDYREGTYSVTIPGLGTSASQSYFTSVCE